MFFGAGGSKATEAIAMYLRYSAIAILFLAGALESSAATRGPDHTGRFGSGVSFGSGLLTR
jgi:hypothetical protein